MTRALILATARRTPEWIAKLEMEYFRRLVFFRAESVVLRPRDSGEKEARDILAKTPSAGALILLEADGEELDSPGFARMLSGLFGEGKIPVFAIGGAEGLPGELRSHARLRVSLSRLTFAHGIARAVLAEQLFRADCILRGHPYPK